MFVRKLDLNTKESLTEFEFEREVTRIYRDSYNNALSFNDTLQAKGLFLRPLKGKWLRARGLEALITKMRISLSNVHFAA